MADRDGDDHEKGEEPTRVSLGQVDAEQVQVWKDSFGVLHLRVGDETFEDVRPVRAFPISLKAGYVSFVDSKAKEIALLRDPDNLDGDSRAMLDERLERMYFVPKILSVYGIDETWGVSHWQVETDCGYASFEVADREQIRRLPRGRVLIVDADENRYEIESVHSLDLRSQKLIESET